MSEYIHKSHNVSVLLYYYVCPAKYRRKIFTESVDKVHNDTAGKQLAKRVCVVLEVGEIIAVSVQDSLFSTASRLPLNSIL